MNRDTSSICTLAKASKSTILGLSQNLSLTSLKREACVRKWSGIRLGLTPETTSRGLSRKAHSHRVLRSAWTVEMRLTLHQLHVPYSRLSHELWWRSSFVCCLWRSRHCWICPHILFALQQYSEELSPSCKTQQGAGGWGKPLNTVFQAAFNIMRSFSAVDKNIHNLAVGHILSWLLLFS